MRNDIGGLENYLDQAGTKPGSRGVVQVVRIFRSVGAVVAACAVLSGCAGGDFDEGKRDFPSTSQVITETQANPWELPIEDRPELFDPCAEIPAEAVEEALAGPVSPMDESTRDEPGSLMMCGWRTAEALFSVLSTWKSRADYLGDPTFKVVDRQSVIGGRIGLKLAEHQDAFGSSCTQVLFTSLGTVWLRLDLTTGLNEFHGRRLVNACDALDEVVEPLVSYIPEGDF